MRTLRLLVIVVLGAADTGLASDAPHDMSAADPVQCDSCHMLHKAPGASLTKHEGNSNLCASCHSTRGEAFVMPESVQAIPGGSGSSHRFDSTAVNTAYGATLPLDPTMASRITSDGKLQCSTCHDQHLGATSVKGRQRTSVPVGVAVTRTSGGGSGTLVLNQPLAAANPKGYRVEVVVAGGTGTATFRVSNDNGYSWFGWSGAAWGPGIGTGRATGASVALNDGSNVTVTFSGTFVVGDRWDFYVSYPLLRMAMDNSEICETCHMSRVQTAAEVETGGNGTKIFSHPIGESLAKSYDRTTATILDANGQAQTTGDGNKTNDLDLDTANKVRCLTCHSPHHADSNSLSEDPR